VVVQRPKKRIQSLLTGLDGTSCKRIIAGPRVHASNRNALHVTAARSQPCSRKAPMRRAALRGAVLGVEMCKYRAPTPVHRCSAPERLHSPAGGPGGLFFAPPTPKIAPAHPITSVQPRKRDSVRDRQAPTGCRSPRCGLGSSPAPERGELGLSRWIVRRSGH
jgi:hypothetical protein